MGATLFFTFLFLSLSVHYTSTVESASSPVKKIRDGVYTCPNSPITEKYPDPDSKFCEYFFLCHRGHAFPRKCPPLHAFHPIQVGCIRRDQIPEDLCPYETQCGFNGYQVDPKDCTKYYLCFYRTPTHYSCTEGKIFNTNTSTCVTDKPRAKLCSQPTPPPHYVSSSTTKRSARSISRSKPIKKVPIQENDGNQNAEGQMNPTPDVYAPSTETVIVSDP